MFLFLQGDGIEFKRHFLRIREQMRSIISKKPPAVWELVCTQQQQQTPSQTASPQS